MDSQSTPVINFDLNWNCKLYCNNFTTIRPRNDEKYQLDKHFDIMLDGRNMGAVKVVCIRHFRLEKLTETMALMDTGYGRTETLQILKSIYGDKVPDFENQEFSYLVLQRIVKDINHNNQINQLYEKSNLGNAAVAM